MTHAHFASYTLRHNTSIYITLYFSPDRECPHNRTKVDGVPHRLQTALSIQCFRHTKSKQHFVKGCPNFPKIWQPPQNCMRENGERIKFHTEKVQKLHKPPTWKFADHVSRTRSALMSFVRIPVLAGLLAHTTPTGWFLHATRHLYPNLTLYSLRATTLHT